MIARTIFEQLGGAKFIFITGCFNLVNVGNGLAMNIVQNKSLAENLVILYDENKDTYVMSFTRNIDGKFECIAYYNDVYCDMLTEIFEEVTGLRAHL